MGAVAGHSLAPGRGRGWPRPLVYQGHISGRDDSNVREGHTMTLADMRTEPRQETRQALKLIARLMRGTETDAVKFILNAGLSEHQTKMVAGMIAASPFFSTSHQPAKPIPAKSKCPECGQWFHYSRVTRRRIFCSNACRMTMRRRQAAKEKAAKSSRPAAPRPN